MGVGKYSHGVYECFKLSETEDKQKVAIKILKRPPTTQFRLKREILVHKALKKCSNIVQLLDYVGDLSHPALVLEFCDTQGTALHHL